MTDGHDLQYMAERDESQFIHTGNTCRRHTCDCSKFYKHRRRSQQTKLIAAAADDGDACAMKWPNQLVRNRYMRADVQIHRDDHRHHRHTAFEHERNGRGKNNTIDVDIDPMAALRAAKNVNIVAAHAKTAVDTWLCTRPIDAPPNIRKRY